MRRDQVVSEVAGALAFRHWQRLVNGARGLQRSRILMYHSFSPAGWGFIPPDAFRRQLRLISNDYEFVALPRLVEDLEAGRPTDRSVAVTIDDAYEDFFTVGYPILRELRIPATLFVPTGLIGKENAWDEDPGSSLPVMSASQLRELDASLITIGSHSVHHRALAGLARDSLAIEVRQSKETLEQLLGRSVTLFAYPFGHLSSYDTQATLALRSAGYRAALTARWGTYVSQLDLFALRRISFQPADTRAEVLAKLSGEWDWKAARELATYVRNRAREAVPLR
jgi:peptidoglycan/xylan/chitin deacetylase (PgdA/CDA1 family)